MKRLKLFIFTILIITTINFGRDNYQDIKDFLDNMLMVQFVSREEYANGRGLNLDNYILITKPGENNDNLLGVLAIGDRVYPWLYDNKIVCHINQGSNCNCSQCIANSLLRVLFAYTYVNVDVSVDTTTQIDQRTNIGNTVTHLYAKNSPFDQFLNWNSSFITLHRNNSSITIKNLKKVHQSYDYQSKIMHIKNLFPIISWNSCSNFYRFPELELYANMYIPANLSAGNHVIVLDITVAPQTTF